MHQQPATTPIRKIIHIDMDCFFAAVEMREQPTLRQLPVAVGGAADRRGVIATCNYEARRYGVRSAMATAHALRLCPQLKLIKPRMQLYKEVSGQLHQIFKRYTQLIEPLSLDEAYLDVSASKICQGSATLIAQQIRAEIKQELDLTASAGVAPNKFLAKIASEQNKPNGQFVIAPDKVDLFVAGLPLEKFPGVGKATLKRLHEHGLYVAKDVRARELPELIAAFGKFGHSLYERSYGRDLRGVQIRRIRKSVGVETTLAEDLTRAEECLPVLERLYEELNERIERAGVRSRIIRCGLKVKFSDFHQTTVEHQQNQLISGYYQPLLEEALQRGRGKGIRLLGVSVGLSQAAPLQMDLPLA